MVTRLVSEPPLVTEDCVLTEVTMTVTGLVSVTPLETADCVTTEVIMLVVGVTEEAEIIDVTTFVVDGSTVLVLPDILFCRVEIPRQKALWYPGE